jgi:hypothetical protein
MQMARKKKLNGRKIIREFIETRFKEVKSKEKKKEDVEADLNKLEKEISHDDDTPVTRTAPVLEADETQTQQTSLETTARTAPRAETEENNTQYSARTTVERGYGQESYTARDYTPDAATRPTLTLKPTSEERTRMNSLQWSQQEHERMMSTFQSEPEYRPPEESRKERLPFEKKKREI